MQRVTTISLNRNAYQLEVEAHTRLEQFLTDTERRLTGNPDRGEILRDIEQAIADRCRERMRQAQTVITLEELEPALAAIGEVDPMHPTPAPAPSDSEHPPLQQLSDRAYISGVCAGLARSAHIDPTLVRVIAIVLSFVSSGGTILLYIALMLLIPYAPLDSHAPPLRKMPRRCRETVIAIRAKLKALTS